MWATLIPLEKESGCQPLAIYALGHEERNDG